MNDTDLDAVALELGIKLPEIYKSLIFKFPLEDEFPDLDITQFSTSVPSLGRRNKLYREKSYYGRPWPPNAFWIGSDGGGGAYFLISNSEDSPVFYINWENPDHDFTNLQSLKIADSLEEYMEITRRDLRELLIDLGYNQS